MYNHSYTKNDRAMLTFREWVVKHKIEFLGLCHLHSANAKSPWNPLGFRPWKLDAPGFEEWHHVVGICLLSFGNVAKHWSIAFGREVQLTALVNIIEMRVPRLEDWKECIECIAISNNAEHCVCRSRIRHVSVNCKCAPVFTCTKLGSSSSSTTNSGIGLPASRKLSFIHVKHV